MSRDSAPQDRTPFRVEPIRPPRRTILAGAVAGGLAAPWALSPAATAKPSPRPEVTDLGPGVEVFTMMSSTLVGDTVYIATRNIEPMKVVGFHLPTGEIRSVHDTFGESTQAFQPSPDGAHLYGCVRTNAGDNTVPVSRLFRIPLDRPDAPVETLGDVEGLIAFTMAVAPDGVVYFGGREEDPGLHRYDPATGALDVLVVPDADAQYGRSLAADDDFVYYGLRARHPETGATVAGLYRVDRSTGEATSILPPELARTSEIRDITLHDGSVILVNGSVGAVLDQADPSRYTMIRSRLRLGKLPCPLDGRIYFTGQYGPVEYDPADGSVREVSPDIVDLGERWGLFAWQGRLVTVSAFGLVVEVDPTDGSYVVHDLIESGAPRGAQLAMSICCGSAGDVLVGGTNAIALHSTSEGSVRNLRAPGEAKDMIVLEDRLYTGQYSGHGIMGIDTRSEEEYLTHLADLPERQNRPHDVLWDAESRVLYVGSGSDADTVGALTVFDPASGDVVSTLVDPFGDGQQVRCMAQDGRTLFLGGEKADASQVLALDLDTSEELFRIDLDPAPRAVCGLVVRGRHLYIAGHSGGLWVHDLERRETVHSASHPDLFPEWGSLTVRCGRVYGISSAALFRLDHRSFAPEVVLGDLDAQWYGVPRIAVDEQDDVYAIRGRNLVRVRLRG